VIEDLASWPGLAPVLGGYVAFLGGVALHDARYRRIPNLAVYPGAALALLLALVRPDGPWWSFVLAGVTAMGVFLLLGIVSRGGMGMGDAKLAGVIGLMTGWPAVLVALFASFATGAVIGLVLMAAGRIGRREPIPFAPALAVGALIAAVAGRPLARLLWPGIA
jgi:leader peptidase (prepilin peptidase) / N-methyltransferase